VLLPTLMLLRRTDLAAVIGEALLAIHREGKSRQQVAAQVGVPVATLRGWRRRFGERAAEIRTTFSALAHHWDPEHGGIQAQASPVLDALEAIGVAAAAGVRRYGPQPPLWSASGWNCSWTPST
jgi:transposase-like protein